MCAIAGIIGGDCSREILQKMLSSMAHRGPDGSGIYQQEDTAILHTRLAVIDPRGGAQPMSLETGEETYVLSYNGELYNTRQLRSELERLGHSFKGHSDTEVLLHGYAQWKEGVLDRCNGIFAFAVWEAKRRKLFLARDRMGVKPLFYTQRDGMLVFGSELKTVLSHPEVPCCLDPEGAAQLLMLGPGRIPGSGVFHNIFELEPGWYGVYQEGKLKLTRYWYLTDKEHRDSFPETLEKVRYLVLDAIRGQMVSDVPLGTFLSGGLDSSIITAICAKEYQLQGRQLHTFSVDYADNDRYFVPDAFQPNSDGHYIRKMEKAVGSRHHWTVLTPEELVAGLEQATQARDLPGMGDVDISLLAFCKQIRSQVTVALSGECADEIFGGYPWYRDPKIRDAEGFPWAQNTHQRSLFMAPTLRNKIDGEGYVRGAYDRTISQCDILPGTVGVERRMKEMVNLNHRWFMQTLLDRKDRMSMFSALEVRVPFCDYRIAEYLYAVPWEFKDHQGREKGLLRKAMEGIVPEEILWRKKSPYPKTWDPRYLELVSQRLHCLLEDPQAPILHMVDADSLRSLLNSEYVWPWYGQLMRVPQTICYFLQLDHWLRHYNVQMLW